MSGLSKEKTYRKTNIISSGLKFVKMDLHIHTPASNCFPDKTVTPRQIVDKALENGLKAIAITDHNTGVWVDRVKEAARNTDLVVFPGVEITVGDAHNHIIALLDIDKTTRDVEDLLTSVGILHGDFGKKEAFADQTVNEVIDMITGQKFSGIGILAHIDSTNGVFVQMNGQPRIDIIKNPNLLAVEACNYDRVSKLLDGTDPDYERKLAVYQSSDNPYLDEHGNRIIDGRYAGKHSIDGIGYRYCFFKVDERIMLESLRSCFIDPDVRIRRHYIQEAYPYIKHVKFNESGFLANFEGEFHQGLNNILGAKGVGKSLLVEFLRFAIDQEPTHKEILDDHRRKLSERLKQYGKVAVVLCDETGNEYLVEREYDPASDNPIVIRNLESGSQLDVDVTQLFPVLFLSQNEIIKIAELEEEQIKFVDRFFDFKSFTNQIANHEKDLQKLDAEFAEALKAYHEASELDKQINTLLETNDRISKQLKSPIFTEYSSQEMKEHAIQSYLSHVDELSSTVQEYKSTLERLQLPDRLKTHEDPLLKRIRAVVTTAQKELISILDEQGKVIEKVKEEIDKEIKLWIKEYAKTKAKYQKKVIELGGDFQKLEETRKSNLRKIEDLQSRKRKLQNRIRQLPTVKEKRENVLEKLSSVYREYSKIRDEKCKFFEDCSSGKLKVSIKDFSNNDVFRDYLKKLKRGTYIRDAEIDQIAEKTTSKDFILNLLRYDVQKTRDSKEATKYVQEVAKEVELDFEKVKILFEFLLSEYDYEELLSIQYKAVPQDRPEIKYNVGTNTDSQFEFIKDVSTGQKCTGLLIIALSDGKMPIVIDQPEDSLDIRSIWEDMCVKLRTNKERRQFIFTTHNSSLAVASDSDKFIILVGDAHHGELVFSGALDNQAIKDEVIRYLEGGIPTYKLKFNKYKIS